MGDFPVSISLLAAFLVAGAATAQHDAHAPEPIPRLHGGVVAWGGGEMPDAVRAAVFDLIPPGERQKVGMVIAGHSGASARMRPWSEAGFDEFAIHSPDVTDPLLSSDLRATLDDADAVLLCDMPPALMAAEWGDAAVVRGLEATIGRGGVVIAEGRAGSLVGSPHAEGGPGLGLVPGAVVLCPFDPAEDSAAVAALLGEDPGRVVLGVERGTALILDERFFRGRGSGAVHAFVAASQDRPLRADRIAGDARGDLIALWRSAQARHGRTFPRKEPAAPHLEAGSLVIVGGGGIPPGLLERFIDLAGGADAPLVYVPCAYDRELAGEPGFVRALRRAGASDVAWIHTKDRRRCDGDDAILAPLRRARGLWFGGGRQWNLVDSYQHTEAHALMEQVLARGGVVGGSSAGASIQAEYMARGNPLGNRDIMAEGYEEGLGFLTGVAIDQHFTQRRRGPDLASLVRTYPQYLGIGIDESTALVVEGGIAEVVGAHVDRRVYFYDGRRGAEGAGQLWEAVPPGGRYDLRAREPLARGDG